jgi:hypothetical protein
MSSITKNTCKITRCFKIKQIILTNRENLCHRSHKMRVRLCKFSRYRNRDKNAAKNINEIGKDCKIPFARFASVQVARKYGTYHI